MGDTHALQSRLACEFRDPGLLERALTHRSSGPQNNERLEFLGDSILGFIVAEWLFQRFPDVAEGKLSRMRSAVVRREKLAEIARTLGLQQDLILGEGELKSGGFNRDSILADAMEGIIGAVYLDSGLDSARQLVLRHFDATLIALTSESVYKDPKSRLQEYLQQQNLPVPSYEIVSVEGEPHQQMFQVACFVQGHEAPFLAAGSSRRGAEQSAAAKAFTILSD